jgi:hypothetical protein
MKQPAAVAALAAFLGVHTTPVQATASLIVNGSGQLTGATGVVVGAASYTVTFRDGTCAGLFGDCDNISDFVFQSEADATAAAQALLDQVLINDGSFSFDTIPGKTDGCAGAEIFCDVLIPYGFGDPDHAAVAVAINAVSDPDDGTISVPFGTQADTSPNNLFTWAMFTPVSSVPEASSWAMMLLGFATMGLTVRRRRGRKRARSNTAQSTS